MVVESGDFDANYFQHVPYLESFNEEKGTHLVDAGEINEAENQLYENLDENDTEHLEMALTFYMYLNQLDDDTLFMANYSREEIVEGINSVSASFGITGFENFVDTTMV